MRSTWIVIFNIAVTVLLVNLLAGVWLWVKYDTVDVGTYYARTVPENLRDFDEQALAAPRFMKCEFPHPFVGYNNICNASDEGLFRFWSKEDDSNDAVRILVLGGSVANQHFQPGNGAASKTFLELALQKELPNRRFLVFSGAQGGAKQPQQLFKLQYLFLKGYKFDVVVNIDGFNELALSLAENWDSGLWLGWPRMHDRRLQKLFSTEDSECTRRWRERPSGPYIELPIFHFLAIELLDRCRKRLTNQSEHQKEVLEEFRTRTKMGPEKNPNLEAAVDKTIALWRDASRTMSALAQMMGFRYLHVIQPNQYLPGSKVLSKNEQENAYEKDMVYAGPIRNYYSRMNANTLGLNGDEVLDLRYVFRDVSGDVYRDTCCHYNDTGIHITASAIAAQIAALVHETPPRHTSAVKD